VYVPKSFPTEPIKKYNNTFFICRLGSLQRISLSRLCNGSSISSTAGSRWNWLFWNRL